MDFLSEVIGETVILGIDSIILGFCIKQLSKCKHILNSLQTAPVLDIDSTLNKEIKKYSNNTIPYVVIRGLVKPLGNPITSNYNQSVTGVIQRLTIKEHVIARTSAGFWSDQTRTIHEVCNSTPFVLSNGKYNIEVMDALAAELLDMDVISDKFEPMSPGVIDHVWGFFSGVRQRGLQTMEEMLRDGSYITAIGELSRSNSGALKIQPPRDGLPLYLTTATKSTLLKRLASSKDFLRVLVVVFASVAAAASCRVAYKYLRRRRRRAHEEGVKRQLAAGRRQRRAHARDRHLSELQLCVVCAENPKEEGKCIYAYPPAWGEPAGYVGLDAANFVSRTPIPTKTPPCSVARRMARPRGRYSTGTAAAPALPFRALSSGAQRLSAYSPLRGTPEHARPPSSSRPLR